jgi:hypothetical protein
MKWPMIVLSRFIQTKKKNAQVYWIEPKVFTSIHKEIK